jgi:hypothetical protein
LDLLKSGEYTIKDLITRLKLDWTENKLRNFVKAQKEVQIINKKPLRYTLKSQKIAQKSLFDS